MVSFEHCAELRREHFVGGKSIRTQARRGWVVIACSGYSRAGAGVLVFSTQTEDLLAAVYAWFSDPDGNAWLLQAITERAPGRV